MRTRNAGTPKTPASQKKTTPAKKSVKTPSPASVPSVSTPPPSVKTPQPESVAITDTKPADSNAEQGKAVAEDSLVSPPSKVTPTTTTKKVTKRMVKKKVLRAKTPGSAKGDVKVDETNEGNGEGQKGEDSTVSKDADTKGEETPVKDMESEEQEGASRPKADEGASLDKGKTKVGTDEPLEMEAAVTGNTESQNVGDVTKVEESKEPVGSDELKGETVEDPKPETNDEEKQDIESKLQDGLEDVNDDQKAEDMDDDQKPQNTDDDQRPSDKNVDHKPHTIDDDQKHLDMNVDHKPHNIDDDQKHSDMNVDRKPHNIDDDQKHLDMNVDLKPADMSGEQKPKDDEGGSSKGEDTPFPEGMEDYGEEEGFVEPGDEDFQEDDEPETFDDTRAADDDHKEELAAAAKERKIKKELEIFVGGLDREVVEDDVKKAFEKVGEVIEVRLLKDPATNKNRGFAFVRFATKDQAKRALSEMKNPVICGKRCGTALNEDNDTLFLGNICNTWTKEAIRQKLKDFSVEGVENITLVQDPRHEGLSRGFCFIQFACHADAMFAYKRLQKPDAIFGHAERTAKVAFAEPLQEPDPEVMAKVKSVFVDGLPPHWDEDRVRKHFKSYGEIERITLARNMSSAKRKDFGFVDFITHQAAIDCINDLKTKELVDGNSKTKVNARLSNPQPKTQAVKGGMCGGFRIGQPTGKSLGRRGQSSNRPNFQHGRHFRGQFSDPVVPYGRRVPYKAVLGPSGGVSGRPVYGGPRYGVIDRSYARPVPPRREPFPIEDAGYGRPFMGRPYDDPYAYDDSHGLKRPYYMTDQDPYMEPSRVRPRVDYSYAGRGTQFRGNYGAGSSVYSSGYYGSDYGARPHTSFNGRDRPYGGGSSYYYQ